MEIGVPIEEFMTLLDDFFLSVSPAHYAQIDHYKGTGHQHTYTNRNGEVTKDVRLYHDSPAQKAKNSVLSFLKKPKVFFALVKANSAPLTHEYKKGYNRGAESSSSPQKWYHGQGNYAGEGFGWM